MPIKLRLSSTLTTLKVRSKTIRALTYTNSEWVKRRIRAGGCATER